VEGAPPGAGSEGEDDMPGGRSLLLRRIAGRALDGRRQRIIAACIEEDQADIWPVLQGSDDARQFEGGAVEVLCVGRGGIDGNEVVAARYVDSMSRIVEERDLGVLARLPELLQL